VTRLEEAGRGRLTRSTAEGAALLRAAGHLVGDARVRGPDDLAARFIAPALSPVSLVKVPLLNRLAPHLVERVLPGGIWFEVARTRGFDDLVAEEVEDGARQVVLLGAGLDSRPYRMAAELAGTTVWEVDHPITAAYKRERVAAVIGEPPANVRYAEVDFEREDLGEALAAAGHDPAARSVVVWSGVTPYLDDDAVAATLRWFAGLAPGSVIGFDYVFREVIEGRWRSRRSDRLGRLVAAQGEPFRWGIPRGESEAYLQGFGLELVEDVGPSEAARRYLLRADGTPAGEMWRFGGFARARVPERG
jgi:methyltransferase (TIGR00027 family)